MAKRKPGPPADAVCPLCGGGYVFDEGRRCFGCGQPLCPGCDPPGPEPLCPECGLQNLPGHIEPMLALLSDLPTDPARYGFEYKWDGIRALFFWDGNRLRIESRNLIDITAHYPEFADLGRALGSRSMVLDGEIVALEDGRPSFPLLTHRLHLAADRVDRGAREVPAFYYVFDIIFLDGRWATPLPYHARRELLEGLKLKHRAVVVPPSYPGEGTVMLAAARERKLEGVVAKRLDSPYEPGRRTGAWRKTKIVGRQEFVVGGWQPERSSGDRIGSLLVGYYDRGLGLVYAGRVGTGFTGQMHRELVPRLKKLERKVSPFRPPQPGREARWLSPRLVAEIEYRRWPRGGSLQQASFKGLRTDKPPETVGRERMK